MESIIKASPVKTRRKFDTAFKLEAVRNWQASGKSAAVVAKELGLAESRLFAWRKLLPPVAADLQAELEVARREIRHLREQRDILKKTLGILSEPPASAMNGFTR